MITDSLANRLLDSVLRPGPVWVSLHSDDPGEIGDNEIVGESYERQAAAFDIASDRTAINLDRAEFRELPQSRIAYMGIWDAPSGGRFLWASERIDPALAIPQSGIVRVEPGFLAIKFLVE